MEKSVTDWLAGLIGVEGWVCSRKCHLPIPQIEATAYGVGEHTSGGEWKHEHWHGKTPVATKSKTEEWFYEVISPPPLKFKIYFRCTW